MPTYRVRGAHAETGEERSWEIAATDRVMAEKIARDGGYLVSMVAEVPDTTPDPHLELLRAIDRNTRQPERRANEPDGALGFFAFVLPIVGIIAGSIRLANRDTSGAGVIAVAIMGMVIYGFVGYWLLVSGPR